jgi:hypothetical protein
MACPPLEARRPPAGSPLPPGGPRLEVSPTNHDEPSDTLVGRSLALPNQAGEMRPLEPDQLGGGGGRQQLVRVRLGWTSTGSFCHGVKSITPATNVAPGGSPEAVWGVFGLWGWGSEGTDTPVGSP